VLCSQYIPSPQIHFSATSLLFITSDPVAACPDATSAATLHTAVDLTDGFAFYTNVADIFSYPNRTNISQQR
jgi:hypothetical protein